MSHLMSRARFVLALAILVLVSAARADASPSIQVPSTFCPGGTGVATLSPPDGGGSWASVQWSITNGTIVFSQGSTLTFRNQSSAPITIGASATDTNGGTFTADPVTVTVHQVTPPDLDTKGSVCIGGNGTAVVRNASSYPSPITWEVTNGFITENHGDSIDYSAGTSGDVLIRASSFDANGCEVSAQWQVHIVPQPSAEISVNAGACPGSFDASVPDGGVGAVYEWSIQNGAIIAGAGTRQIVFVPADGNDVTLDVTVTEFYGGCSNQGTYTGQFVPGDGPQIVLDRTSACPAQTVQASISGTYASINWSVTNGWITADNGSSISFQLSGGGGPAHVVVSVSNGPGCEAYDAADVAVLSIDPPAITVDQPSVCPNFGVATATIDGQWSTIYWSAVNGEVLSQFGNTTTVRSTSPTEGIELWASVTDGQGCSTFTSVQIPLRTIAPPAITVDQPSVCPSFGVVTASIDGVWTNIYWSVLNGEILSQDGDTVTLRSTSPTSGIELAAYVSDAEGCSTSTNSVQIPLRTIDPPAITVDEPSVCPSFGVVTASIDGVWTNIYWSVLNGEILSQDGNTVTVRSTSPTSGIELVAYVTDAEGCSTSTSSVQIPLSAAPTVTANGPTTFCEGGNVTLSVSQTAGASYLWSNGATTPDITVASSGTFSVSVTSPTGCVQSSAPVAVTVNENPTAGIHSTQIYDDSGSGTVVRNGDTIDACGNPTVRLIPLALNASYSYSWSTGATTAILDVTSSGTYSVTVTTPGGCATTSSVTVNYGAFPPKPAIAATETELCPAGGSVTLTASNADAWTWSNGATTQSIIVNEPGSYTVRVRNGACESELSDPVVITTGLSTITTNDSLALCGTGSSATLTANDGTSWLWSNGATTRSIVVTEPGTFSVTTTNNGCTMPESSPVTVTARSLSIDANGPTTFCAGDNVTLTASDGTSWLWSNGATTQSITVYASGSYGVTATFADGCVIAAAPVSVEARQVTVSVTADRTTVCTNGAIELSASASGGSGYTYQWYDNTYAPIAGATSPTLTITPSASGFVYVKVTDALGCEASSSGTSYTVLPTPDATITTAASLCEGQSGSASVADAGPGATYAWTIANGTLSFPNAPSVTFTPSGLDPVTLSVTVANAGCSVTSSTIVTVNPLPVATVSASGPTTFCAGGSVTLTASAGSSYLWSNGATTQSIEVTSGGNYSVAVTNATGCSATSAATAVTVNALPAATITPSGPTTFCAGGSVTLTASAGASYLWSNGATTQSINVTTSGNFTVTVTSAAGCSATSVATSVTVNANPSTPTITASGPTTFCPGGSVTLTAPAGSTYLWSNGATTQAIVANATGSYSVTVTNASGCSAVSAATSVTVNAATSISQHPQSRTIPKNTTTTLSVTASGTGTLTYQWYRGTSPSTATPISGATGSSYTTPKLTKGTYTYWVRVTGTCGVANSTTATLIAN